MTWISRISIVETFIHLSPYFILRRSNGRKSVLVRWLGTEHVANNYLSATLCVYIAVVFCLALWLSSLDIRKPSVTRYIGSDDSVFITHNLAETLARRHQWEFDSWPRIPMNGSVTFCHLIPNTITLGRELGPSGLSTDQRSR